MPPTLDKPIAVGRTAEVFAWGEGTILKLYRDGCPAQRVEYEAKIAHAVSAAGLPVPAEGDLVQINGRYGLVYERVDGPSMFQTMGAKPWTLVRFARQLAELHAQMHACSLPDLPSQRRSLERAVQSAPTLPPDLKQAALQALTQLPDGDRLCHGDFHPDNVVMTARGPIVIDWMTATSGHPLADVARTSLLLSAGAPLEGTSRQWLILLGRQWFHKSYLSRYFELCPGNRKLIAAWRPVIAAARLNENIAVEQEHLLALVRSGLTQQKR
jgi:uncharacterized protein (TIGR02172 family)